MFNLMAVLFQCLSQKMKPIVMNKGAIPEAIVPRIKELIYLYLILLCPYSKSIFLGALTQLGPAPRRAVA